MPMITSNGIQIAVQEEGSGDPVMLITGLSGAGAAWGDQTERFARTHHAIVPDHRGTGASDAPADGYTIEAHAADMAGVIRALDCGPAHIVGSSTGGAIAQLMALDHPDTVSSIALVSSWARADDHFRHQFAVRKEILGTLGARAYAEATALFLFSPGFFRDHYPVVRVWCDVVAGKGTNPEIMGKRIDMIVAHDTWDRLGDIDVPTLVLVGEDDGCTPPHLSRELAGRIPGAEYAEMAGGHLVYKEQPEAFHANVMDFIRRHTG